MISRYVTRTARRVLVAALIGGLTAGWLAAQPAAAGKLADLDTSLNFVPEGAAFYSSMFRNKEQIEIIANSRAWAKLKAMPIVEKGLQQFHAHAAKAEGPAAGFQKAMKNPMVVDLLGLLGDMFSHDVFVFANQDFVDFIALLQQVGNSVQYGPAILQLTGQAGTMNEGEIQARMLLRALAENVEAIKIPTVVAGFKVTDTDRAKQNLANLKALVTTLMMTASTVVPELYGCVKETEIDGHQYLTISLNGEMIPWDKLPLDQIRQLEAEKGDLEKVIAKAKQLKLVIAIGLRDDYLLLYKGQSTDCLAELGKGELLIDRAELKPLEKFADRRLNSVSYVSKTMNARLATGKQDIDSLLQAVEEVLPHTELPPDEQQQIRQDAAALAEDIKQFIPEPGAVTAFSFLTDQGMESYSYNWGGNRWLDGSKPLTLLEHVGGDPLMALAVREVYSPGEYDLLVKWLKVGYRYFEKYAVPKMPPGDRQKYEQFVQLVCPLAERLDKANRQMLFPALADSQSGLVLDAKLKIQRLHEELPDFGTPMPIPEPAVVLGVSDAELLRQACAEYRAVLEGVIDALRKVEPDEIPEFEIPKARVKKTEVGRIYSYRLPQEWAIDRKLVPSAGLSDTTAVLTISPRHAQRLLTAKPLATGGLLAGPDRPMAVAFLLDWAGLMDAATPWAELAARQIIKQQMGVSDAAFEEQDSQAASMVGQVRTVLEVLKVFRTLTVESRFQDGVLVTHSLAEIRDID